MDHQPSAKRGASITRRPFWNDEAAAVEDQAVLAADRVGVEQHGLVVAGARGQHLAPRGVDAHPIGRGRDVDDHLGAGVGAPPHRAIGRPGVLAHLRGDDAEVEAEDEIAERETVGVERQARTAAREGAAFVEDVVGGELFLRHQAEHPAAVDDRGAVEEPAADRDGHAQDEDRGEIGRLGGEAPRARVAARRGSRATARDPRGDSRR